MPGGKLTAEQKAEIITAYASSESIPKTAIATGHTKNTVSAVIHENTDALEQAKKAIAADAMDKFLATRQDKAKQIVDKLMESMLDDSKIDKASLQQIAMSLGIVIDKFTPQQAQCGPVAIQINFNAGGQGGEFE